MCFTPPTKFDQHLGLVHQVHVRDARQDLLEDEPQVDAGQIRTEAEAGTAAAERDLLRRLTGDVEAERIVEHGFVTAVSPWVG
jgi:hypothetical protein